MNDSTTSPLTEPSFSNRRIIDVSIQPAVGAAFVIASFRILGPFIDRCRRWSHPHHGLLMEWLHYGAEEVPQSSPEEAH